MHQEHTRADMPPAVFSVPGAVRPPIEGRKEHTILRLVCEMERRNIPYVVMRNHEAYPAFGHDADFAIRPRDLPRWQALLVELAQELGWDALTRCHHWDSKYAHQSPKSFLLYSRHEGLDFLCVDLFHGATLWGLPLFTVEQALRDAVRDERGFYRMAPARENLLRLLQVDALIGRRREQDKVEAYTRRIRSWWPMCGEDTLRLGRRLLGPAAATAGELLLRGDIDGFKRQMKVARLTFLGKSAVRHPFVSFDQAKARSRGRLREAGGDQCGFVVCVPEPSGRELETLREALEFVSASNAIREWTEDGAAEEGVTSRERAVMEQGSLAVKHISRQGRYPELDRAYFASSRLLASRVFDLLIERHEVLYRSAVSCPAATASL